MSLKTELKTFLSSFYRICKILCEYAWKIIKALTTTKETTKNA